MHITLPEVLIQASIYSTSFGKLTGTHLAKGVGEQGVKELEDRRCYHMVKPTLLSQLRI
jgi:hypothetical protein